MLHTIYTIQIPVNRHLDRHLIICVCFHVGLAQRLWCSSGCGHAAESSVYYGPVWSHFITLPLTTWFHSFAQSQPAINSINKFASINRSHLPITFSPFVINYIKHRQITHVNIETVSRLKWHINAYQSPSFAKEEKALELISKRMSDRLSS